MATHERHSVNGVAMPLVRRGVVPAEYHRPVCSLCPLSGGEDETKDALHAYAREHKMLVPEVIEHALHALLDSKKRGGQSMRYLIVGALGVLASLTFISASMTMNYLYGVSLGRTPSRASGRVLSASHTISGPTARVMCRQVGVGSGFNAASSVLCG